jgi:hypothetical protein
VDTLIRNAMADEQPPDPTIAVTYAAKEAHAIESFQTFADYFIPSVEAFTRPMKTYKPEHVFRLKIPYRGWPDNEIHGWVDRPNPIRPNSCPVLRFEIGNRLNPGWFDKPGSIVIWKTTVPDDHTPIDFSPAVAAWHDWFVRQETPLLTPSEQHADKNENWMAVGFVLFFLGLIIASIASH